VRPLALLFASLLCACSPPPVASVPRAILGDARSLAQDAGSYPSATPAEDAGAPLPQDGAPDASISAASASPDAAVAAEQCSDAGPPDAGPFADCAGLTLGAVPDRLDWTAPAAATSCDAAEADCSGDVALGWWSSGSPNSTIIGPDGGTATWSGNGCAVPTGMLVADRVVETAPGNPPTFTVQLQWQSPDQQPLGDWHDVVSWSYDNLHYQVQVDTLGNALVLWLEDPPMSHEWWTGARWMGKDGPLGAAFVPVTPECDDDYGYSWFRGFGTLVQLIGGGIAQWVSDPGPQGSKVICTPGGWWEYPSGASAGAAAGWLSPYPGTVQLLRGGAGYWAVGGDGTCGRTLDVLSPSGNLCSSTPLADAQGSWQPSLWLDGTLVLQNGCGVRWWPGLAR